MGVRSLCLSENGKQEGVLAARRCEEKSALSVI